MCNLPRNREFERFAFEVIETIRADRADFMPRMSDIKACYDCNYTVHAAAYDLIRRFELKAA